MWTGVVATTGNPGLHEVVAGVHLVDVTRPDALLACAGEDDVPVLVTSHPAHAHAAAVACTLLGAHRPSLPVAHTAVSQAPLAGLLAMAMSLDIARDAGHGASVWRDVSDAVWSAVVVPGVARLPAPNPSFRQHARSLLPRSRYLVRLHPDPEVIGAGDLAEAMKPLGRGVVHVYSDRLDDSDPLLAAIVGHVAPRGVYLRELPGRWDALFGRAADTQLAMVPADFQSLLRPRGGPCRSCGLSVIDAVCVFCRLKVPGRDAPGPSSDQPDLRKATAAGAAHDPVPALGRTS